MHSYAGLSPVRHYGQICCLIIMFVMLLLLLLVLLCPLYTIMANSSDNISKSNKTSSLHKGGFRTLNGNKLNENPNSQQEVTRRMSTSTSLTSPLTSPLTPPWQYLNASVVDIVGDAVVGDSLADHNNLPKSRIAAGRVCGKTNCAPANSSQQADRKSIGSSEGNGVSRAVVGWRINSGDNSWSNISNEHKRSDIQSKRKVLLPRRNKRFIIFSGGGVIKFVMGVSFPIALAIKERSFSYFYNLQIQYQPPTEPIYWWNYFNSSTFAARHQQRQLNNKLKERLHQRLKRDVSREFVYAAIEQIFERKGIPGEPCLLQAICEVSQLSFHVPRIGQNNLAHLWHALANAVLIPTVPNVAMKYLHASQAGRFGVDCQQTFNECPQRVNEWLRNVAHME